ncbi:NADH dehydrogenase [ubiquinone] 1 alpha subcomplex subunit 12 [Phaffia rhodozyma]|uniref:NADH dehydrogenase [ubiquinone] 1 alpha subcomplex subunit 12 n=1 Tax=Phaffia rhodozyma TaxID=264483 RepID=A0A0F7SF39_PHARH|nr:NADH dehydrogenase [ubiquinone] 1 alpha subcomplex subunit 12 [Phaffia rhodozyma]
MRPTDIFLKQPGLFARAFQLFNPKNRFLVGYDLEGNRFLERPSSESGARTKRTVEYAGKLDHISDAIARNRNLSVQWKAWLSHTRAEAPTVQELENDLRRRQELYHAVQNIQMREEEDIARMEDARRSTLSSLPPAASFSASHSDPRTLTLPSASVEPDIMARSQQTGPTRSTAQNPTSGAPDSRGPSESPENRSASEGEKPVIGTRTEGEWKPEGWSPSISRRRG